MFCYVSLCVCFGFCNALLCYALLCFAMFLLCSAIVCKHIRKHDPVCPGRGPGSVCTVFLLCLCGFRIQNTAKNSKN